MNQTMTIVRAAGYKTSLVVDGKEIAFFAFYVSDSFCLQYFEIWKEVVK